MSSTVDPSAHPAVDEGTALAGRRHSPPLLFATMMVSSIVCLIASAVLAIDAVILAAEPAASLSCDINAVVSCATVAQSWQANVFGFPNAFIGLATEPVILTIAVAGLGGARFPRWFLFAAQIGYALGLVFAYWLFVQSLTVIGALCPWCLTITVFTTITFFTLLHLNVVQGNLYLRPRAQDWTASMIRSGADYLIPALLIALIVLSILLTHGVRLFA
ncbi:vitamin K epoxide reductase family protein [Occultella gossypii]|nr:vitamin K epoxide reductase family protein [Occultella gossypii]